MSHQPIYLPAMREARAREVAQDYPGALTLWREAVAQLPEDSRERIYCTAQAAQCERVIAKLPADAPVTRDPRTVLAEVAAHVRACADNAWAIYKGNAEETQLLKRGDPYTEGRADAYSEISGMLHTENAND